MQLPHTHTYTCIYTYILQQAHKSLSMRICGRRMHSYLAVVNWGGAVVVVVVAGAGGAAACCPCFVKRLMQQNAAAGQE